MGILRCTTWNVWPENKTVSFPLLDIKYWKQPESSVRVQPSVRSYKRRSEAKLYLDEPTTQGPQIGYYNQPGSRRIRGGTLLGTREYANLSPVLRHAHRGEIDIRLTFGTATDELPKGDIGRALSEALRAHAFEVIGLLNLKLDDFVAPTMDFQIHQIHPTSAALIDVRGEIRDRRELSDEILGDLEAATERFFNSDYDEKYRVALDLYAAHINEEQARVRFILLVIAMEAIARKGRKENAALRLLADWKKELEAEIAKFEGEGPSEELYSLEALKNQLDFREEDGLAERVRKLFKDLPGVGKEESEQLQEKANRVYSKRSTLVHKGHIPAEELPELEKLARELLERLFRAAIDQAPTGES